MRKQIFALNESAKNIKLPSRIKDICNKQFDHLSKDRYKSIPLKEIFHILKKNKIVPVDDNGQEWEGMLSGAEGKTRIDLHYLDIRSGLYVPVTNSMLILTWYKLDYGKYEIVVYLS